MAILKIQVILGSIRPERAGEKVFTWVKSQLKSTSDLPAGRQDVGYEFIDLKDWNLPLEIGASPKEQKYDNKEVVRWSSKVRESDGFIIISPEYNHGYSAALKNALDNLYYEWNNKPVAFVAYGAVGGARAVEQLRQVAVELQMVPVRNGVHILEHWNAFDEKGMLKEAEKYNKQLGDLVTQLLWWANTLKTARDIA